MAGFKLILDNALSKLNVNFNPKEKQICTITIHKKDCFCILRTGYGKSVIYQVLPFVSDGTSVNSNSMILVILPLTALISL